jgi:hypothetical protein
MHGLLVICNTQETKRHVQKDACRYTTLIWYQKKVFVFIATTIYTIFMLMIKILSRNIILYNTNDQNVNKKNDSSNYNK